MPWLTRNSVPSSRSGRCIFLPNDANWRADFYGAISELYKTWNWEKHGTLTPDENANEWLDVIADFLEKPMSCLAIGTVVDYGGSGDLPDNYLDADGSEVLIVDYPELYSVYGSTYGAATSGYFRLPDCRVRATVGSGTDGSDTYALGDTGGETSHQLSISELPQHYHIYNEAVISTIVIGELAPTPAAVSNVPANTSIVGEDTPHENRQKFIAFRKCVIAF